MMQLIFSLAAITPSQAATSFFGPITTVLFGVAGIASTFFIIVGGFHYIHSRGEPEKLLKAKRILTYAFIGLALVAGAAAVTGILGHAYGSTASGQTSSLPVIPMTQQSKPQNGLQDAVLKTVAGTLNAVVSTVGEPFVTALGQLTVSTPLMGSNKSVFTIWLVILGVADAAFIIVVILLGLHVMSFSTFGFSEIDVKELLPQLALVFLAMNMSLFLIDGLISFSNGIIHVVRAGMPDSDIWLSLQNVIERADVLSLGALLIMVAFIVIAVILVIYYVSRIITLAVGAILSPLVILMWLIPAFKDFTVSAAKLYITTIAVLFVHVVILLLASSLFSVVSNDPSEANPFMTIILGIATLLALLKAQGVMNQLSLTASGPRAARQLGTQFMRSVQSFRGPSTGRNRYEGNQIDQSSAQPQAFEVVSYVHAQPRQERAS